MDISYFLQDLDEITITPSNEKGGWTHGETIKDGDSGFIVSCYVELHFTTDNSNKAVMGQFYYFLPHGEELFDVTKIIPELSYQSFSRVVGYVMSKTDYVISVIPTLSEITQSFEAKGLRGS